MRECKFFFHAANCGSLVMNVLSRQCRRPRNKVCRRQRALLPPDECVGARGGVSPFASFGECASEIQAASVRAPFCTRRRILNILAKSGMQINGSAVQDEWANACWALDRQVLIKSLRSVGDYCVGPWLLFRSVAPLWDQN